MNESARERESVFHDQWAASVDLKALPVREAFEAPTALENRFILRRMGDLRGRRLLDIGCGLGESSVFFALQGAQVTATDLSPGMVETAVQLGLLHSVRLEGIVAPGEELPVASNHYHFVYAANTLARLYRTAPFSCGTRWLTTRLSMFTEEWPHKSAPSMRRR